MSQSCGLLFSNSDDCTQPCASCAELIHSTVPASLIGLTREPLQLFRMCKPLSPPRQFAVVTLDVFMFTFKLSLLVFVVQPQNPLLALMCPPPPLTPPQALLSPLFCAFSEKRRNEQTLYEAFNPHLSLAVMTIIKSHPVKRGEGEMQRGNFLESQEKINKKKSCLVASENKTGPRIVARLR